MPERHLHAVVDAIASAGSNALAQRAAAGAAVPFDLVETASPGSAAPLFSYRPRTRDFVEEQADALRHLPSWPSAVNVLAGYDGLGDYLLARGERQIPVDDRDRADLVLRVMLAEMHSETGDFLHTPTRARDAADGLARCLLGGLVESTVVVPLLGVRLVPEWLRVAAGIELVRDDTVEGLPREARSPLPGRAGTVVRVSTLEDPAEPVTVATARPLLRTLLTALRLFDGAAPALAPLAWTRVRGGGWAPHPFVGMCARATGTLDLTSAQGADLRAFYGVVADDATPLGEVRWALRRFELACERPDHGEGLTDTLLALRNLLGSDSGDDAVSERLAELRAGEDDTGQAGLAARFRHAARMERSLMTGEEIDPRMVRAASLEMRDHLRGLLRDVASARIDADLIAVADRVRQTGSPVQWRAPVSGHGPVPGRAPVSGHGLVQGRAPVSGHGPVPVDQPTVAAPAVFVDQDVVFEDEPVVFEDAPVVTAEELPGSGAGETVELADDLFGDSIEFTAADLDLIDETRGELRPAAN